MAPTMPLLLDSSSVRPGLPDAARKPIPISTLASALASAPPEQQRMMLGEQLYPLVEKIEQDQVGKVTGMLLEMDQTEVLHLIESPDALLKKVGEAMEVLRLAHDGNVVDQIG
ncbi:Polyadenylate-binding protein 2 [Platanthera guangdongensis]|uniref:Polyadenylate-binding protein 2 n=1 Tax=Platanthera guangdongensis TaxID=2320717 RepID=A0ABR2LIA4_9ASPA